MKAYFRNLPLYPLIFSVFPAISLFAHNISEVRPTDIIFPLIFSFMLSFLLYGLLKLILRSVDKAGLLCSLLLVIFFSAGHIKNLLNSANYFEIFFLILIIVASIGLTIYWWKKSSWKKPLLINYPLNLLSIILLLLPICQILEFNYRLMQAKHSNQQINSQIAPNITSIPVNRPDVYYIILDMYPREDILLNDFDFDNSQFIEILRKVGFYIADCTLSNYAQTQLSLASSLNYDYLDNLGNKFVPGSQDRTELDQLILHSKVRSFLDLIGYTTVSLSAYAPLQWPDADIYYSTDPSKIPSAKQIALISPFEALFIKNTAGRALINLDILEQSDVVKDAKYPFKDHINQQLYILNKISQIKEVAGPKFVFIHIQIPHPPFVFQANGDLVNNPPPFPSAGYFIEEAYWHGLFRDQVTYLNSRLIPILESLINNSGDQPIIILQGDHGPNSSNRNAVLNAFYVNQTTKNALFPSISPVNTFRIIFNSYFDSQIPIIPDRSYYSDYSNPYFYQHIEEQNDACIVTH